MNWMKGLTPREIEVGELVADGKCSREIGDKLGISRRTTEHHIYSIYKKLALNNRWELISRVLSQRYAAAGAPRAL